MTQMAHLGDSGSHAENSADAEVRGAEAEAHSADRKWEAAGSEVEGVAESWIAHPENL